MPKRLVALSSLVVLLAGALIAQDKLPHTPIDTRLKVIDVIDGDTIVISNKARVRLLAASAPELVNCYGPESRDYLKSLLLNKKVILAETVGDQWGRIVALVFLGDKLVNADLVNKGFARYESEKTSQSDLFKAANIHARDNNLGIYSPQCYQTENTKDPKCNIKGNIEKSFGTKTYHRPDCNEYGNTIVELSLGEQWFCTEADALTAGFTPSAHCPK
jgi:endonuclease YncB( thermonuclease family)